MKENADVSDDKQIRAAIYCRVSTEDQAKEGYSLSAQEDRLKSYCNAKEWIIEKLYIDDGYSGRTDDRPAYSMMMEEKDQWDVMVVLKMDRIHRNSKNFTLMMEGLKREGKEFTSMQESFDTTTAMGRFVMDIIQRIAQLESEQIGERVYIGMRQKAIEGKGILGFNIPFGYCRENEELIVNIGEAENVKLMFRSYMSGDSLRGICRILEEKSIQTKKGSLHWDPKTVSRILSNPIYCGYLKWEDVIYPSNLDSIIDEEIFKEVQILLHGTNTNNMVFLPDKSSFLSEA
ncbi:MAG: recombinase family protein [Thermoplasmata archaeon]|nr:recombinase family protein [Thermoplasmata archaeon]